MSYGDSFMKRELGKIVCLISKSLPFTGLQDDENGFFDSFVLNYLLPISSSSGSEQDQNSLRSTTKFTLRREYLDRIFLAIKSALSDFPKEQFENPFRFRPEFF